MPVSSKSKSTCSRWLLTACSLPKWKMQSKDAKGYEEHASNIDTSRRRSIGYLILFMFLSSINFTAVIPSIYPYLKSLKDDVDYIYLGMCYSAYSLGQMIASPLFGYLAVKVPVKMPLSVRELPLANPNIKRASKLLICFGMLLEIIGSLLYVIALDFPTKMLQIWSVIVSRFIVGFGVGASAIYRGYVNSASTSSELSLNNTLLTVAQSLGFIVGPAFQTLFTLIPPEYQIDLPGFHFNVYTAIGHFTVVLTVFTLVIAYFFFEEVYPDDVKLAKDVSKQKAALTFDPTPDPTEKLLSNDVPAVQIRGDQTVNINRLVNAPMVLLSFAMYFMVMANFIGFESLMNPVCQNYLGWTGKMATANNGILMVVAAISSIVIMVGLYKLMTFVSEIYFVFIAFTLMAISCLLMIPLFPPGPPLNPIALSEVLSKKNASDVWTIAEETWVVSVNGSNFLPFAVARGLTYNLTEEEISSIGVGGCDPRNSQFCFEPVGLTFAQIIVSFAIFLFGYSIGYLAVYQIFGKVIAKSNGSFWMGWLTAIGSLSRCVTPAIITATYPFKGTVFPFALLFSCTVFMMLCAVVFYFYHGRKLVFSSGPGDSDSLSLAKASEAAKLQNGLEIEPELDSHNKQTVLI